MFPQATTSAALKRLACDQLIFAPTFIPTFFIGLQFLDGDFDLNKVRSHRVRAFITALRFYATPCMCVVVLADVMITSQLTCCHAMPFPTSLPSQIRQKLEADYVETLLANWALWVPAQVRSYVCKYVCMAHRAALEGVA